MKSKVPPFIVRSYSKVTSTNEIAKEIASSGDGNGTIVVADHQTSGRGRRGRSWYSPHSTGLWATLILSPELEGKQLFTLGLAAAVAISKVAEIELSVKPSIQWPNDLHLSGGKFAGILVETVNNGNNGDFALVGMGVNLNQEKEDFPGEIREIATSLRCETGEDVDRERFLGSLRIFLRSELQVLYDGGFEAIKGDYIERSNLLRNQVTVRLEEGDIHGRVVDFGHHGEMLVSIDGGGVRCLTHGEVHKVWP
jgi:BirA family biotin operon repressor/biotin-[acetyl-CoA-carboxylase] ligase